MTNPYQKATPGSRRAFYATGFNAMIDAAREANERRLPFESRGRPPAETAGTILVKNGSGLSVARFGVLGIGEPVFGPSDNLAEFKNRPCFGGGLPDEATASIAIVQEPLAAGAVGRAITFGGVSPVLLGVDPALPNCVFADVFPAIGVLGLGVTGYGPAQVLWREAGTGTVWGVVALTSRSSCPFAIAMVQVGGADGSSTVAASWTYDVKNLPGDTLSLSPVDPGSALHRFRRPALGAMVKATYGLAHYEARQIVIDWCNEVPVVEACL